MTGNRDTSGENRVGREPVAAAPERYLEIPGLDHGEHHERPCQTNLIGAVEPTIEDAQAASWRHSAKAAERLSLKFSRL